MTVEIKGVCLTALEKIASKHNKETIDRWRKGEDTYLRKWETPETILTRVILGYLVDKYPDVFDEVNRAILDEIDEIAKKAEKRENFTKEDYNRLLQCSDDNLSMGDASLSHSHVWIQKQKLIQEEKEDI